MKPAPHPLLIAHRGESRDAPENTLGAIRLAWERGACAVEIDVRLTADGEVVVMHDADLSRVGGSRVSVAGSPLATLRALDIGRWKHARWTGERVPLVAEVFSTMPAGATLFVEVKVGPEIVPALRRVVEERAGAEGALVFMSFHPETVRALAEALPEHGACLLRTCRQWRGPGDMQGAVAAARACGATALDLEKHASLDEAAISMAHAAGLRVYVWTVNSVSTARRLARAGVDGITTDRCAWMRMQFETPRLPRG